MNNKDYANKAHMKIQKAKDSDILLLELYPNIDWQQHLRINLQMPVNKIA